MTNIQKCGVIGVGFVGATCAYTLAVSGLFSDLVLVDMNRGKAIGEAADINHGVAFSKPCRVMAGDYADLAECGLIIIAAGANQKPGESRLELLGRNKGILSSVIAQLTAVNREAILLVVSNPVDVLTCLAQQLSGFPAGRVLGSGTVLDTARLKYLLGQRLGVDSRNVHAFIIGEHGDSELAVWSITAALPASPNRQMSFPVFMSMCAMQRIRLSTAKAQPITVSVWRCGVSRRPLYAMNIPCCRSLR